MFKRTTTGDSLNYNFLIQNFFIIGLEPEITFNDSFYQNIKIINQYEKLVPKILSKFPDCENFNQISNDIIIRHCFPNGFFIKNSIEKPESEKFYFSLDNLSNEIYPKIYYTCFLFYENAKKYYELKENYKLLSEDKEISTKNLIQIDNKSPFVIASNSNDSFNSIKENEYERYFIPKVICFSSLLFFPKEFIKILSILYSKYSIENNPITEPIEKVIENIYFQLPLIPKGLYSFTLNLFDQKITFSKFPINKLPYNSVELNTLFELKEFKLNDILTIYKFVLLEIPILFFSEDKYKLTSSFFTLQELIYPFKYCNSNNSILPINCFNLIENCDSFMFGINKSYSMNFFHEFDLEIDKEIAIIDLDKKKIEMKYHDDNFSSVHLLENEENDNNNSLSKIDLPIHYKKKLLESLGKYLKKLNENKLINENKFNFNYKIREFFFYFLMSILLNYQKYVKYNNKKALNLIDLYLKNKSLDLEIESIFNVNEYLMELSQVDNIFYKTFFKTNMFKNFIIKKIYPKNLEDKIEILYFDERIIEKKNKSVFINNIVTPFILKVFPQQKNISIKFENYFSTNEMLELSDNKRMINALLYYQKIYNIPNEEKINIEYPIFPKLLNDKIFFGEEYLENMINRLSSLTKDYITLNKNEINKIFNSPKFTEIYFNTKYNFNLFTPSKINMETYVNFSWLILMGLSFSYINNKFEKNVRFYQIIEKLHSSKIQNEEILIFLFYIILEEGSEENILTLIDIIFKNNNLKNKYLIASTLAEKFTNVFNIVKLKKTNSLNLRNILIKESDERNSILKDSSETKRTLYQLNNENETIAFCSEVKCSNCNEINELKFYLIFQNNYGKGLKVICKNCKKEIIPQIKVQINENKLESFDLLTPLELYESLRNNYLINKFNYFDVTSFHNKNKNLFWNSLFYFSMKNLPFDFIIPYEQEIKKNESIISFKYEEIIIDDFEIEKGPQENFIFENKKEIKNPFPKPKRNNSFSHNQTDDSNSQNFQRIEDTEIDMSNRKLTLNNN